MTCGGVCGCGAGQRLVRGALEREAQRLLPRDDARRVEGHRPGQGGPEGPLGEGDQLHVLVEGGDRAGWVGPRRWGGATAVPPADPTPAQAGPILDPTIQQLATVSGCPHYLRFTAGNRIPKAWKENVHSQTVDVVNKTCVFDNWAKISVAQEKPTVL